MAIIVLLDGLLIIRHSPRRQTLFGEEFVRGFMRD